ncbi:M56 family metallopeptidase [Sphingomonas sp. ERG5]|uniref:M56 family metallopeptidase n=1 Tax=Sphingomonas sp. ERG5 TaxID=1381597 RepID=UPI00054C02E9|nr:M56 family metallopeptidase [Sphingomonas sp. ERG5]
MSATLFAGWALEALIASTILMIGVLVLRAPVRRAFGPDVTYALWALPVLRLLLPPIPESWREIAVTPVARASETITIYVIEPLGGAAAATAGPSLTTPAATASYYPSIGLVLLALWAVGAVSFLAWHAISHLRFCRRILDRQVRGAQIDGGIHLIETDAASGPLAFGIVRKYVAFPRDFVERYDREERDLALAHELGHHARGDLIANWVALFILALHWFNPIAWRAFRAFRADQEIANDAGVLAGLSPIARHTYACAIVKSAHGGAVSAACHLHTINDLKGRLRMLTTNKTSRSRLIGGAAAVAMLTVAGLGFTASGTKAAAAIRSNVQTATGVDLARLDIPSPVAPVAPVPPAPAPAPAPDPAPVPAPATLAQVEAPEPPVPPAAPEWTGDRSRQVTTTTINDNGKKTQRVRIVMRDRDGKVHTEEFDGMAALQNIPGVSSINCGEGGDRGAMVINKQDGGKHRIVICRNRIDRVAREGAETAAKGAALAANNAVSSREIERKAYRSALSGLRSARADMARNIDLTGEARDDALESIDDSIRDMEANLARVD